MTLSCGDVFITKDHSARLLSEIAQQIKKRLKIGRKKKVSNILYEIYSKNRLFIGLCLCTSCEMCNSTA